MSCPRSRNLDHYATMDLPEGKTCANCRHSYFCDNYIGTERDMTQCDWFPIRFIEKPVVPDAP